MNEDEFWFDGLVAPIPEYNTVIVVRRVNLRNYNQEEQETLIKYSYPSVWAHCRVSIYLACKDTEIRQGGANSPMHNTIRRPDRCIFYHNIGISCTLWYMV